MTEMIKLQTYRKSGSRMYSGREYGLEIRSKLRLNEKDSDANEYIIEVSEDTIAINSSFFGGLFSDSVKNLGEKRFREKYIFVGNDRKSLKETIRKDIEEGIKDAVDG